MSYTPNNIIANSTGRAGNIQNSASMEYHHHFLTFDFLPVSTGSTTGRPTVPVSNPVAASSADEQSFASSTSTLFDMARYPTAGLFCDPPAFTQVRKRSCDLEALWSSAAHCVTIEYNCRRPADWGKNLENAKRHRGIKASKSESHLSDLGRCRPEAGHGLEEYSLGSGSPYGWSEAL
jgi:hypothetical protein